MKARRASGCGLPRILIRVRGRVGESYAYTTDRTGLVPVPVMVVMMAAKVRIGSEDAMPAKRLQALQLQPPRVFVRGASVLFQIDRIAHQPQPAVPAPDIDPQPMATSVGRP